MIVQLLLLLLLLLFQWVGSMLPGYDYYSLLLSLPYNHRSQIIRLYCLKHGLYNFLLLFISEELATFYRSYDRLYVNRPFLFIHVVYPW